MSIQIKEKVMQSSSPPIFRIPLGNGADEVAIADAKPFNVLITNDDESVDTFAAVYFWNSRQYIFSDVLPSTAVIEVIQ